MILHGIEYQRPTSLNMRILADHVTYSFWHSWSQFFIFAWDVTAGGILRTGVLICLVRITITWWRHQMEIFSVLLAFYAGNPPVTGEFHAQRPVTQSFDVFFDLCLNKRLSIQSWGWWFEMPLHSLWIWRGISFEFIIMILYFIWIGCNCYLTICLHQVQLLLRHLVMLYSI